MVIKVNPKTTKEELRALLESANPKSQNRMHFGKMKGVFGDGLAYQKAVRADEE